MSVKLFSVVHSRYHGNNFIRSVLFQEHQHKPAWLLFMTFQRPKQTEEEEEEKREPVNYERANYHSDQLRRQNIPVHRSLGCSFWAELTYCTETTTVTMITKDPVSMGIMCPDFCFMVKPTESLYFLLHGSAT